MPTCISSKIGNLKCKKLIKESINSLINEFEGCPDIFISEADFQYRLFCILSQMKEINLEIKTKDGKRIKLVHPEYPTVEGIQLKRGKGYLTCPPKTVQLAIRI